MNAQQRELFEETLAADQRPALEAQLEALQAAGAGTPSQAAASDPRRPPRRQALPEHLERIEHRHVREKWAWPVLPALGPGAGRAADHRQRHAGRRAGSAYAG